MKKKIVNNWQPILIVLMSLLAVLPLFQSGYFSHHDDLQVIRIFEMRKCITDLQIPCRWVPDMGFGYGFPMFNYYGIFPYIVGALTSYLTGYIIAAKVLFLLPLVLGGVFVYLLTREVFGKEAALLAGVLYSFAPYRAVDAYVRGAITELYAITIMPIVLYFFFKLKKKASLANFLGATLSLGIFLLNHNIITMVFCFILGLWLVVLILSSGTKNLKYLILSGLIGVGLSSFFIVPALFEKNLVQIANLKESYYIPNFRAHFVTLRQLFLDRSWGYGASTWLEADEMPFQVGLPHWVLALFGMVVLGVSFLKKYLTRKGSLVEILRQQSMWIFFVIVFVGSLFMTHNKSAFIWEKIDYLQYMQFPWRFLGFVILSVSVLGGLLVPAIPKKIRKFVIAVFIVLAVGLNVSYFKPAVYFKDRSDTDYLSGEIWDYQQQGAILDYLPNGAQEPKTEAPDQPTVLGGKATIADYQKKSNSWKFSVVSDGPVTIVVPTFDFPYWKVKINGATIEHRVNDQGYVVVNAPSGQSLIEGRLINTPLRIVANSLSILSVLVLIGVSCLWKKLISF